MKLTTATLPFLLLVAVVVPQTQSTRPPTTPPAQAGATPLLLAGIKQEPPALGALS